LLSLSIDIDLRYKPLPIIQPARVEATKVGALNDRTGDFDYLNNLAEVNIGKLRLIIKEIF